MSGRVVADEALLHSNEPLMKAPQASVDPPSLAPFDLGTLERDEATICALDGELRIIYVNAAWRAFSRANGGTRIASRAQKSRTSPGRMR